MNRLAFLDKRVAFWLLVAGVAAIGLLIPKFYDWSGADQSRRSPQAELTFQIAIGFVVLTLIALPWLPVGRDAEEAEPGDTVRPFQFNVKSLLIAMSLVAVLIAGFMSVRLVTVVLVTALALAYAMWVITQNLEWKWQTLALLSCMYLPWAWVLIDDDFKYLNSDFAFALFGIPSFLPAMIVEQMIFGERIENSTWLLFTLTAVEFGIGNILIRLGPKRALAWLMVVLLCSIVGSFGLNALMRM